jgi:amino acid transporter
MAAVEPKGYPTAQESPHDSEKGVHVASPGHGDVPEDFRESDFRTRNGLNLKSFQRRTLSTPESIGRPSF